jgi:endo-1,3(4)-beta-glucanase
MSLTIDNPKAFSVNINFSPQAGQAPILTFSLVQGMGFVTGVYKRSTPLVESSVFFRSFSGKSILPNGIVKYVFLLEDGTKVRYLLVR